MNELMIFNNVNFGEVRMANIKGKAFAVASDVAKALGYKRPADAVTAHTKGSVIYRVPTSGGEQNMKIIPQGDVIRLIVKCPLDGADKFESWIFDEVIPSVMNNGHYTLDNEQAKTNAVTDGISGVTNKATLDLIQMLLDGQKATLEANEQLKLENEAMKPKVSLYDVAMSSEDTLDMKDVAKVLGYKGLGRNKLFSLLRAKRVLMYDNIPYQSYIDNGWFSVIERPFVKKNGEVTITKKTVVYQKGLSGINKLVVKHLEGEEK